MPPDLSCGAVGEFARGSGPPAPLNVTWTVSCQKRVLLSISVASIGRFDLEEMLIATALVMSAWGPETGLGRLYLAVSAIVAPYIGRTSCQLSCSSCVEPDEADLVLRCLSIRR